LLVDDHRTLLWALEQLVGREKPKMEVVGSATNRTEALELARKLSPDVIVLDLDLGEESGLDAISGLIAGSKAKLLVLTRSRDQAIHDKAAIAGARGIVDKQDTADTIAKAIEKIHQGQLWLNRVTTGRVFVELSRKSTVEEVHPEQRKISSLTSRERAVIAVMAANGKADARAVAEMLHISESTLRNHLTSIHAKLEVANRLELFIYANKHGLNQPG
jgi:DNA-binding NarL/FixJ family response regulator